MEEKEKIKQLLKSNDSDEVYSALIDIGKGGYFEFKPDVEKYLGHNDVELRAGAIRVLAFYWQLDEYKDYSLKCIESELDPYVKSIAIMSWAIYFKNSNNKNVINKLFKIMSDKNEDWSVRVMAYRSIISVAGITGPDRPNTLIEDVDNEADWDLVNKIINS